jgi:hypothetical protein
MTFIVNPLHSGQKVEENHRNLRKHPRPKGKLGRGEGKCRDSSLLSGRVEGWALWLSLDATQRSDQSGGVRYDKFGRILAIAHLADYGRFLQPAYLHSSGTVTSHRLPIIRIRRDNQVTAGVWRRVRSAFRFRAAAIPHSVWPLWRK